MQLQSRLVKGRVANPRLSGWRLVEDRDKPAVWRPIAADAMFGPACDPDVSLLRRELLAISSVYTLLGSIYKSKWYANCKLDAIHFHALICWLFSMQISRL